MAEYHEGFWVAVATVGPVLALSFLVSVERSATRFFGMFELRKIDLPAWLRREPALEDRRLARARARRARSWRTFAIVLLGLSPYAVAAAGFILSGVATLSALDCLSAGRNLHSPSAARLALSVAFTLLFANVGLALILSTFYRFPGDPAESR